MAAAISRTGNDEVFCRVEQSTQNSSIVTAGGRICGRQETGTIARDAGNAVSAI